MKILIYILSVLICYRSFAQKNDSTLLNADKEFAALSYKLGVANAFEKFLANDAVFLSSTPLPVEGKSNFMKMFANTKSTVIWQPTGSFKDKSSTSGYTYGLSKWIYPVADSLACSYYVYSTNWIKDDAAQWKVTTDIGSEISLKSYSLVSRNNFKISKKINTSISKKIKDKKWVTVHLTFESDRKGFVPAIIVKPNRKEVKAVVFYQHGVGDEYNKEYFLEEAEILAENGIASFIIDAPFKRKGDSFIESGGMKDAEIFDNNCVEWLQAIDILPAFNIPSKNIFFVGQSYGARVAAFMPYLDARFKKILIVSGIYNYTEWLQTTVVNQIAELRKAISPQDFKKYISTIAGYDASLYLSKKNDLDFYFQAAKNDETLSEYDILSCYEMTNSKKRITWYNGSHNLTKQAKVDRIEQIIKWANENTSH